MTQAPGRPASSNGDTVAVVLSGAGARGAFQAGALAELVPALEREGHRPTIWLGTSAGSINAVLWASRAHLSSEVVAEQVLDLWRTMSDDDVYVTLPLSFPLTGLQYGLGALLGVGRGTTSLLDTAPLRRTAHERLDTDQLRANVADGLVSAVGVVGTRMPRQLEDDVVGAASGRSVLFLDEHSASGYVGDPGRALDVVHGPVQPDHVLASCAIPVAFPPVRIAEPAPAAAWYVDGGVRLNTPLQPAVGLGASRIVLVSATATTYSPAPMPGPSGQEPDVADASAQVLNAALADRTTEDLRALRRVNRLVAQVASAGAHQVLAGSGGEPYRTVDVLAVSPPPGELGRLASDILGQKTRGLGRVTELDNWLLGKGIRGAGDAVGRRELLSYLFFDEDYFAAGIELGRQAAAAALQQGWER
jgi:NTE family protein